MAASALILHAPTFVTLTRVGYIKFCDKWEDYNTRYIGGCTTPAQRNLVIRKGQCCDQHMKEMLSTKFPDSFATPADVEAATNDEFEEAIESSFLYRSNQEFINALRRCKMAYESVNGLESYNRQFKEVSNFHGNANGDVPNLAGDFPPHVHPPLISVSTKAIVKQYVDNLTENLKERVQTLEKQNLRTTMAEAHTEMESLEADLAIGIILTSRAANAGSYQDRGRGRFNNRGRGRSSYQSYPTYGYNSSPRLVVVSSSQQSSRGNRFGRNHTAFRGARRMPPWIDRRANQFQGNYRGANSYQNGSNTGEESSNTSRWTPGATQDNQGRTYWPHRDTRDQQSHYQAQSGRGRGADRGRGRFAGRGANPGRGSNSGRFNQYHTSNDNRRFNQSSNYHQTESAEMEEETGDMEENEDYQEEYREEEYQGEIEDNAFAVDFENVHEEEIQNFEDRDDQDNMYYMILSTQSMELENENEVLNESEDANDIDGLTFRLRNSKIFEIHLSDTNGIKAQELQPGSLPNNMLDGVISPDFTGTKGIYRKRILADTGADLNLVSLKVFQEMVKAGAAPYNSNRSIRVGNGAVSESTQAINIFVKLVLLGINIVLPLTAYEYDTPMDLVIGHEQCITSGICQYFANPELFRIFYGNDKIAPEETLLTEFSLFPEEWTESPEQEKTLNTAETLPDATETEIHEMLMLAAGNEPKLQTKFGKIDIRDKTFSPEGMQELIDIIYANIELFDTNNLPVNGLLNAAGESIYFDVTPKKGALFKKFYPRAVPEKYRQFLDDQIDFMLKNNLIIPDDGTAIAVSPAFIVKRTKNDKLRLVVDYREVNDQMETYIHGLPLIKDSIKIGKESQWFATLDMKLGFHQLLMSENAQKYHVFSTPHRGNFRYLRLPMGPKNGPMFFNYTTSQDILNGINGIYSEVFVDDICIPGKDEQGFLRNLRIVLERLKERNVRLSLDKCVFAAKEITYLGYIIDALGARLEDSRIQPILQLATPTNSKEVRSVLGMCNQFRDYIVGYADIVYPLTRLTSKVREWQWTEVEENHYRALLERLTDRIKTFFINDGWILILKTDASTVGCGGILIQMHPNTFEEQPIQCVSHVFSEQAKRWITEEQECYGIVYPVERLHDILIGRHFFLETDNRNLLWMHKSSSPKVTRWRLRLQQYNFTILHSPGVKNPADCISRLFKHTSYTHETFHSVENTSDTRLDHDKVYELISQYHNSLSGHHGIHATVAKMKRRGLVWSTIARDVYDFIRMCPACQKIRLTGNPTVISTTPRHSTYPFEVLEIDFLGPFPPDRHDCYYILVIICAFSRYVELIPTHDATAVSTAKALIEIVGRYGCPAEIRSDRGTHFLNELIMNLLVFLRIEQTFGIPNAPRVQGIVERANAEILRHLKTIVFEWGVLTEWSVYLPLVRRILNISYHSEIDTYPQRILFGDALAENDGLTVIVADNELPAGNSYLHELNDQLRIIVEASIKFQMKRDIDKYPSVIPTEFRNGDYVLISYPTPVIKPTPTKLHPYWRGPWIVLETKGNLCKCKNIVTQVCLDFHRQQLKPYNNSPQTMLPEIVASRDNEEVLVEDIVDHRYQLSPKTNKILLKTLEFRIRYANCGPDQDEWLSYNEVKNNAALDRYIEQCKDAKDNLNFLAPQDTVEPKEYVTSSSDRAKRSKT